jgi:hypothetical protein
MARPLSLKSPRLVQKKRRKFAWIFSLSALAAVAFLYALSQLASLNVLTIQGVAVTGAASVEQEGVSAYVQDAIAGKYLWLLPKANIMLYPKDALTAGLLGTFPGLESAELGLGDGRILTVTVVERKPTALWCAGDYSRPVFSESDEGIPADCYFMDDAGLIYSKAPIYSGSAFMRYYGLVDDGTDPLKHQYMDADAFATLGLFVRGTRDYGLPVAGLSASTTGAYELYLDGPAFADGEARILFDAKQPLDDTFGNLTAFFDKQDFKRKGETVARQLDYLDLSFGSKIYYKWRE